MKTIQKHEWEQTDNYPLSDIQYFNCKHCQCVKRVERGDHWYFPDKHHFVHEEPPCITRQIPAKEAGGNEAAAQ